MCPAFDFVAPWAIMKAWGNGVPLLPTNIHKDNDVQRSRLDAVRFVLFDAKG
jgi:hypothetical protein